MKPTKYMRPWEQTWTSTEHGTVAGRYGDILQRGPSGAPDVECARLASAAPEMARLLLEYLREGSMDPEEVARALEKAGVSGSDEDPLTCDWFADGGSKRAPDHWQRNVSDDVTLTVWPRLSGRWVWEGWLSDDRDNPKGYGEAASYEEATQAAEQWAAAVPNEGGDT